jgi:uncharacterized protein YqhQ
MNKILRKLIIFVSKQYTSIGGQAVIEGVMMRSPNAFVVAVRLPNGRIRLRRDQWYGLSQKLNFLKKPFVRGVLVLIETMANGIVSLNYSANQAMEEEGKKASEKIDLTTFLSIGLSFIFGIGLFVMLPHFLTALIESNFGKVWGLDSFMFHAVDGVIKATIFILYIFLIGFIPDIRRVFQYHGAEHKSISTFEAQEELTVENAMKYPTFHPRCGTTFIFFLLFISIILFAGLFVFIKLPQEMPFIMRHISAIGIKVVLTFPVAGISYEIIKKVGAICDTPLGRAISFPGMMLQRLTTKEPDEKQLEVALASIKAVLYLEDKFNLKEVKNKVVKLEEIDLDNLSDVDMGSLKLKDFLES